MESVNEMQRRNYPSFDDVADINIAVDHGTASPTPYDLPRSVALICMGDLSRARFVMEYIENSEKKRSVSVDGKIVELGSVSGRIYSIEIRDVRSIDHLLEQSLDAIQLSKSTPFYKRGKAWRRDLNHLVISQIVRDIVADFRKDSTHIFT